MSHITKDNKKAKKINLRYINLVLTMFFISIKGYSFCFCPPLPLKKLQQYELKESELIFVGEITDFNKKTQSYKVKIEELFRGELKKGDIIIGENLRYCTPHITRNGKWIIYGKIINGVLKMNECGISRSFKNPQESISSILPPLPPENEEENNRLKYEQKFKQWKKENKKQSGLDLKNEIIALRKLRTE